MADDDGVRVALVEVRTGKAAVLEVAASIRALHAQGRPIAQVVYDPMRYEAEALRLEADLGLTVVEWPQTETRMTRCSENLHRLVIEQRLRHAAHPTLDAHVANAIAMPTPRGWRLVSRARARTSTPQSRWRCRRRWPRSSPPPPGCSGGRDCRCQRRIGQ